ncbi:MAG: hypothetical protein ABFE13_12165 [Phycisphaerales bacterium]
MIPPQQLIVTCESPEFIASFWAQMTTEAPDVFNAAFVLSEGNGCDD